MCAARDPMADLRAELIRLHGDIGSPTLEELKAHADRLGFALATSTVHDLLTSRRLARWETVRRFVCACREHAVAARSELPAVRFDEAWWQERYDARDAGELPGGGEPTRSSYLRQVRRLVPVELRERATELVELAEFCTAGGEGGYRWYRARAWAGKSALLAWFVLHPPRGVRVVSFFVTSRLPQHSNRSGFIAVVLEQLAGLLHRPVPGSLTDATSGAHLLAMLEDAAEHCQARDERLVLVVDGLDEDLGVTVGPAAYSIAALLPDTLVAGLRVVVSARPRPPIPGDVPDHHPLRDPAVVRELPVSPYAEAVRNDAQRELAQMLHGTALERDMLGLLVAAGGGLTIHDLAELTDGRPRLIGEHLRAASGRTFLSWPGRWRSGAVSYGFAHETLLDTAAHELAGPELDDYRSRLHVWADGYRDRGWPADTPEYLLAGYPDTLRATGDQARMVALATDRIRHNRMLDTSDSDVLALNEIAAALDTLVAVPEPDLPAIARLAVRRDALIGRNATMPTDLPALWLDLGDADRAEILALGITPAHRQRDALLSLIVRLAADGHRDRAERLATQLDALHAAPRTEPEAAVEGEVWSMALVRAAAAVGRFERAITVISSITDRRRRIEALTVLAESSPAEPDRTAILAEANRIVHTAEREERFRLRSALPPLLFALGEIDLAKQMGSVGGLVRDRVDSPRNLAGAAAHALDRAEASVAVARVHLAAGDRDRAVALAVEIEMTHRPRRPGMTTAQATAAAEGCARLGWYAWADRLTRGIRGKSDRAKTCAAVALATAARDPERACATAWTIRDTQLRTNTLRDIVRSVAATSDDLDRVARIATSIRRPGPRSEACAVVVEIAAAAGDLERCTRLRRLITHLFWQSRATTAIALAHAAAGDHAEATALVATINDPDYQADGWLRLAQALLATGDLDAANPVLTRAEECANRTKDSERRTWTQLRIVQTVADAAGDPDQAARLSRKAVELAGNLGRSEDWDTGVTVSNGMWFLIRAAVRAGDLDRAESLARAIMDPIDRCIGLKDVVDALLACGEIDRATALARTVPLDFSRADTLAAVAAALLTTGSTQPADTLVAELFHARDQSRFWRALATSAPIPSASRCVAHALHTGSWHESVPQLVRADPSALIAILDECRIASPN